MCPHFLDVREELVLGIFAEGSRLVVVGHSPVGLVGYLQRPVLVTALVDLLISQVLVAFSDILFPVYHHGTASLICLPDDQVSVVMKLLDGSPNVLADVADVILVFEISQSFPRLLQSVLDGSG